jgi:hypothetical protein
MRVLIADRNVRLLESISLTFGNEFSIRTASTLWRCTLLLQQGSFDLVVVSEKLADGPGLRLLGQIARNTPRTLRILAASRSQLQLLSGDLARFALFRTIAYPVVPRELLSALTLARACLRPNIAPPTSRPVVAAARLPTRTQPMAPVPTPSKSAPPIPTRASPLAPVPAAVTRPMAPAQRVASERASTGRTAGRRAAIKANELRTRPREASPRRGRAAVGVALAAASVLTTLALRNFDAAARSTDTQVSANVRTANCCALQSRIERPDGDAPSPRPPPTAVTDAKPPNSAKPPAPPPPTQMAAAEIPIADPSTFGSEAAEPIYPN